jgi:hypothetical protein
LELLFRFTELLFLLVELLLLFTAPEDLVVDRVLLTVPELLLEDWLRLIIPLLLLLDELRRFTVPELREVDRVRFTVPELRLVFLVLLTVLLFAELDPLLLRTVDDERVRFTVDRVRFTRSLLADDRTFVRTALRLTLASFLVERVTLDRFRDASALVLGLYVLDGLLTTVFA